MKIYLNENYDPNCITQIVTTSLKEIPVTSVDNIVVSVPNEIDSEECFSTKDFETFLQVWKVSIFSLFSFYFFLFLLFWDPKNKDMI